MTVETVLAIAGCVSLFVGIFGGGIEIKEIKIPPIPTWARILFSFIGFFFVFVAVFLIKPDIIQSLPKTEAAPSNTEPSVSFTSTATTSTYITEASAVITSPDNFSFVEKEQAISGNLLKVKPNESAFLCVENRSENPITNCYGELKTNMVDAWTVTIKFRSENQPFDVYVVVTADDATAEILRQSKDAGIFIDQLSNVKTISEILSVTSR